MANPLKGQIELELGSQTYKARLTMEAIMGIESALNKSLLKTAQQMAEGDVSVTQIINILHPALRGGGNNLSMKQVMAIVEEAGIVKSTMAVSTILTKTLQVDEEENAEKKPEAD
tara:strand:- start:865 stop:1209 length:345 start_codon:yes stop_codon:yes gene_type:complete